MSVRNFALTGGLLMLTMGCFAFIPELNSGLDSLPVLYVNSSYGLFLDLFPMNIFNKIIFIFLGIAGMASYFSKNKSIYYSVIFSKAVFWILSSATILGMLSQTNTLSGYCPLFGNAVFIHGFFAIVGGYFAYLAPREVTSYRHNHQNMHNI
jgi:uncharacterized membrane protein